MTKKIIIALCIFIVLLVIYFVGFKIFRVQDSILKMIYPTKYSEYVEKYADEYGVDKYLIYALIKAESNFNPEVTSSSDARGLMQLMEETAVERSNLIDEETIEAHDLYDPETNIRLGTSYLSYFQKF